MDNIKFNNDKLRPFLNELSDIHANINAALGPADKVHQGLKVFLVCQHDYLGPADGDGAGVKGVAGFPCPMARHGRQGQAGCN